MKKILMLFFVGLLVFSCSSRKSITKRKSERKEKKEQVLNTKTTDTEEVKEIAEPAPKELVKINSTADYINIFSEIAKQEMELYGIPASITLAQGILESNSGKGRLSVEANNHSPLLRRLPVSFVSVRANDYSPLRHL